MDMGSRAMVSRDVLLPCIVNAAMGVLYVWSLFALPIERMLDVDRSWLSVVSSVSLVSFTLGMVVHGRLLRWFSPRVFALIAFGLASIGHLLFALAANGWMLVVGYGLMFGLGSGLGYGLALALVTRMPTETRAIAIGIVMASFAASGVMLSVAFGGLIQTSDPSSSFLVISLVLALIGFVITGFLPRSLAAAPQNPLPLSSKPSLLKTITERRFVVLAAVFFFLCFCGLMMVAHASAIFAESGLTARFVALAPGTFTLGYIFGALFGGKLVELTSGKRSLVAANVLMMVSLINFMLPASPVYLVGVLAIGAVFGGSASLMPVLIGETYGQDRVGNVFGKLMISYGAAGLLSPWLTGLVFANSGSYDSAIYLGIAMCLFSISVASRYL